LQVLFACRFHLLGLASLFPMAWDIRSISSGSEIAIRSPNLSSSRRAP
jgi:hypothetical protein